MTSLILLVVLIASPWISQAQVTITLPDFAIVEDGEIRLGNFAFIEGKSEDADRLRDMSIPVNINEDQTVTVNRTDLKGALKSNETINITGALTVQIAVWNDGLPASEICGLIERYFSSLSGDSLQISIKPVQKDAQIFSSCEPPVSGRILNNETPSPGQQVISLDCIDGSGKRIRHHQNVRVKVLAQVAHPLELIKRGSKIAADNIEIRTVAFESGSISALALSPHNLIGLEASRHLSPGSPIRWDQVCLPPDIRKGDGVEIVVKSGSFKIKAAARALESGSAGDEIWVRLESNQKRLRAVVVDTDHVTLQ
ncbi:flagella basal body P-ring formation protein FlgA [candidate division LCP-89 bacterium B3_LCP]|uniref:Flagella basal body P-ring formation protein FlgA n=1 Tax=candidate division LCP-89 bacterium B3_LCP TaxID=2012998 RepID=A0A532UZ98_UNCL8|nr:MAG: flagella basal body P-ring formation protein FlgA [candidate division LCP-89 bacterium B3_LCP]